MKNSKFVFLAIALIVIVTACKKGSTPTTSLPPSDTASIQTIDAYVLNQGNYGHNNTTLSYYNFGTATASTDTFANKNNFHLGDTGSDFIIYGGKMYIVMNNSGELIVANAATTAYIDSISFQIGGVNKQPENIVGYGNHVFVSTTDDSVSVIDTAALTVTKTIAVGANPAQMVIVGTNLYVSNTGGFSANFDSTVSVINLTTLTQTAKIKVGINPGYIAADSAGYIYVACTGDYVSILPTLVKVNINTNTVTTSASVPAGVVRYYNNKLYITGGGAGSPGVQVINPVDLSIIATSFISDGTTVTLPYGLDIDPTNGDVYVADAKNYTSNGTVFCFNNAGKKKFSFVVGPTPIKTVLIQN